MNTERRYLFKKSDSYLFSLDVAHLMTPAGRGWNFAFQAPAKATGFNVYNVRNDNIVNDREALIGTVLSVVGRNEFRTWGDVTNTEGKVLILARDGVVIECIYYGTGRLEQLGQRKLLTQANPDPIEVRLSYWLRFDSSSARYRWLVQSPCLGFGRAALTPYQEAGNPVERDAEGLPIAFTFDTQLDVYALS